MFLANEGKILYQQKDPASLDFDTRFIAVVLSQIHALSQVCLYSSHDCQMSNSNLMLLLKILPYYQSPAGQSSGSSPEALLGDWPCLSLGLQILLLPPPTSGSSRHRALKSASPRSSAGNSTDNG